MTPQHVSWTAERWAQIETFMAEGVLSCGQMAQRLGLTKNAVIGKINRMVGSGWSECRSVPRSTFEERMDRLDSLAPARGCCYPIGDPGKPRYRCCGEPTFEPNPEIRRRLCAEHHRLCWEKVPKRHAVGTGMTGAGLLVVRGGLDEKRTSGA